MSACSELEEIHGFNSAGEYRRFQGWLVERVELGRLESAPVDLRYVDTTGFEEWWYRCAEDGSLWRLVAPDAPFPGLFAPVDPLNPTRRRRRRRPGRVRGR